MIGRMKWELTYHYSVSVCFRTLRYVPDQPESEFTDVDRTGVVWWEQNRWSQLLKRKVTSRGLLLPVPVLLNVVLYSSTSQSCWLRVSMTSIFRPSFRICERRGKYVRPPWPALWLDGLRRRSAQQGLFCKSNRI